MKPNTTHASTPGFPPGPPSTRQSLTPRQEEALSTDRHLSVTANAGSGKTAVLVERYVRILLRGEASVDQIVVLTYTDKAAGELRRRIAAALDGARNQETGTAGLLASIREQLPGAFIGTIHSFCARILREYAVEAGIDPNFGVLEGIDQQMVVEAAIRESLGGILQDGAPGNLRGGLYSLLRDKGRIWLSRTIAMLIEKRDMVGRLTGAGGLYSLGDEDIHRRWQALPSEDSGQQKHQALLTATRTLLWVTRQAIERYDQAKLSMTRLDYEDLQLRTRALLANEHVRSALVRRFRFLMVDEFQDANFLQYELLLPLLAGLQTGNLFVVGDPRQSIYGFRHADPAVFEAGRKDILRRGSGGKSVAMDESFRPLPAIAAFVNVVFPGGDGTGFEPLVAARKNTSPGRVELLLCDDDSGHVTEAEMIARRIVHMLDHGETVFDGLERPRRAVPGDIAILIRSRTALPGLEEALVRHAIPFAVTGGVGFFQTQDLLDVHDYLRFLLNPSDSIALAGILRSPFFHLSDAELFEMALERGERNLWEFMSAPDLPAERFQAAAAAAAVLRQDMELGLRLPPAELIDRIVGETLYVAKLAGDEQGRQRLANLEKFRQFAHTSARRGIVNLYDFVERVTVLVEREVHEGEEEIDSPEDAVRVMTVHAAKGLEFPVVILPRLHKRFQYDHEPYLDEQLGIGFSLPGEGGEEEMAPIATFMKEQSKQKTIEEEKRILYVACTRARDMLVLSGKWEPDRQRVHAFNWILVGLGIDQEKPRGTIRRRVRLETLRTAGARTERRKDTRVLRIPVSYPADLPVEKILTLQQAAASSPRPRLLIDPLEAGGALEEFTGEMLRSYVECPNRYFARYVLGTPEDEQAEASATFDAKVEALLRRDDRQALLSLVPSKQLGAILRQPEIHILLPVATSVPKGILSDTLPLVYQDSAGVWSLTRMQVGGGHPGTEHIMRDCYRFLLEFDLLLLQRLKDATVVRGTLILALHPDDPMVVEADQRAVEGFETAVSKVLVRIQQKEYGHRATPCPVCHVRGR